MDNIKKFDEFEMNERENSNVVVGPKSIKLKDAPLEITSGDRLDFKGSVVVCDPCYIKDGMLEDNWQDFCDMMFDANGKGRKLDGKDISMCGTLTCNGVKILYSGTAWGDGAYPISTRLKHDGEECGVDAGMLCVVNMNDLPKISKMKLDELTGLGVIVHGVDCEVEADGEGNIVSNDFTIMTTDDNDEE